MNILYLSPYRSVQKLFRGVYLEIVVLGRVQYLILPSSMRLLIQWYTIYVPTQELQCLPMWQSLTVSEFLKWYITVKFNLDIFVITSYCEYLFIYLLAIQVSLSLDYVFFTITYWLLIFAGLWGVIVYCSY